MSRRDESKTTEKERRDVLNRLRALEAQIGVAEAPRLVTSVSKNNRQLKDEIQKRLQYLEVLLEGLEE